MSRDAEQATNVMFHDSRTARKWHRCLQYLSLEQEVSLVLVRITISDTVDLVM